MPTAPLISFLIPVLSPAPRLWRAAASVESLGERAELIIIDARTPDQVAADGPPSPSAVCLPAPEPTEPVCMNAGLAQARGRFIAWIDPWAWYEPIGLAMLVERANDADVPDIIAAMARYVNDHAQVIFEPVPPDALSLAELARVRSRWFKGRSLVRAATFIRTEAVRSAGGYTPDNPFAADHELLLRLAVGGARYEVQRHVVATIGPRPPAGDLNREMVRAMVRTSRAMLDTQASAFGDDVPEVLVELSAMQRKIDAVDAMLARWRVAPGDVAMVGPDALARYREALASRQQRDAMRDLAAPSAQAALAAGLRDSSWWHAMRIVVVCDDGAQTPHRIRAALGPRRAHVTFLTLTRTGARAMQRTLGGWTLGKTFTVEAIADAVADPAAPLDLLITDNILTRLDDPIETLRRWTATLRPGGAWLQLCEPRVVTSMPAYIGELSRRMIAQLSLDSDMILDGEADEDLSREAALDALARQVAPELPSGALWAKDHPGRHGLDIDAIGRALRLTHASAHRFGGLWHHPMTPWPMVDGAARAEDAWITSIWRRE